MNNQPSNDDIDVCRVCELVDKDVTKKEVLYCSICDAKICDKCRPDIIKRALAASIEVTNKAINSIKTFFK